MASDETFPFPHPRHRPTPPEVLFHKNVIDKLDEEMEAVEKEITSLYAHLQHLRQKKVNHISFIAPVRRLPPELLGGIVHECLDNGVKLAALTEVRGTFRDVVIGMPTLWNNILLQSAKCNIKIRNESQKRVIMHLSK
jgi:hypothetical protein